MRLDGILKADPRNTPALTQKGRWQLAERKIPDAITTLQTAVSSDPGSEQAHYVLGLARLSRQDFGGARAAFTDVLKINPTSIPARIQLSRLHLAASEGAEAAQLARDVLEQRPDIPVARLTLIRAALIDGDIPRAEAELAALRKTAPDASALHVMAGFIHAAKRELPAASREFSRAIELDSANLDAFEGLVGVDVASGRAGEAIGRVEARLESAGPSPRLLLLASRTYLSGNQPEQAEKALRRTIELDPDRMDAYAVLGQLYVKQNRLPEALREFDALIARQPQSVPARTMAAIIAHALSRRDDAKERYRKIVEIDAGAAVAANNLAWMYAEDNENLDLALQLAQAAKARAPESAPINDTLGWIYYRKGLATLAIDPLRASVEREPRNASYLYHLGLAYAATGNTAGARESLEKALGLQANFNGADEARKTLTSLAR
jgi:tetratricopeptide (TPR) repeat protein